MIYLADLTLAALFIISNLVVVFDQIDKLLSHAVRLNDSFLTSFSVALQGFPLHLFSELIEVLVENYTLING